MLWVFLFCNFIQSIHLQTRISMRLALLKLNQECNENLSVHKISIYFMKTISKPSKLILLVSIPHLIMCDCPVRSLCCDLHFLCSSLSGICFCWTIWIHSGMRMLPWTWRGLHWWLSCPTSLLWPSFSMFFALMLLLLFNSLDLSSNEGASLALERPTL